MKIHMYLTSPAIRNVQIALVALLLCLSSCASLNIPKPDVSIVNLQISGVSLLETSMDFTLRIDNTGPDPLALEGASYRIYLNGTDIGTGMSREAIEVPSLGSAEQQVVVRLSNFSMIRKIQSLVEQQRFDYRVEGNFYVRRSGIRRTVSVVKDGTFDVKDPLL